MTIGELDIVETKTNVVTFFENHHLPVGTQGTVIAAMDGDDNVTVSFLIGRYTDIADLAIEDLTVLSRCPLPGDA